MFVYVGTYTVPPGGNASGIEIFSFESASGVLTQAATQPGVANPSYLVLADETLYAAERYLYAVSELDEGLVSAYRRDRESGALTLLNSQSSHGSGPCYVSLDPTGGYALVANYTSGSIAALPIDAGGSLQPASSVIQHEGSSVNPERQEGPHAHMIAPTPDGKLILASDLGIDRVVVYRLEEGRLIEIDRIPLDPGSGPRHFAFHPNGRVLYVLNELSSTVSSFAYDPERGSFDPTQTVSTLPDGFSGENSCAQIVVSPDGRNVYASNRGHDSIAIFATDADAATVSPLGHQPTGGREPRNFTLDPSGAWLVVANQISDNIVTLRRNDETGLLEETGMVTPCPTPVCVVFAQG